MPFEPQQGITNAGREPINAPVKNEAVEVEKLWEETTGTYADALSRNYQEPGGGD